MSSVRKQLSGKWYIVIKEVFFLVRNSFRPFKLKLPLFRTSIKFAPLSAFILIIFLALFFYYLTRWYWFLRLLICSRFMTSIFDDS